MPYGLTLGQLLSVSAAVVNLTAAVTLSFAEHPKDQYRDEVQMIQKDRLSEFAGELGDFFARIEEAVDAHETVEDVGRAELYALVGQNEISDDDLTVMMNLLNRVERPTEVFRNARQRYTTAQRLFLISAAAATLVSILSSFPYRSSVFEFLLYGLGAVGVVSLVVGLDRAYQYLRNRQRIDEMVEETVFVYDEG